MKPNARLATIAKLALAVPTVMLAAATLGACTVGVEDPATSTTTSAPATTSGSDGGVTGDCPIGTYDITNITGKDTVDIQGQTVKFGGAVSDLSLTIDKSTWELTGDQADAKIDVAGVAQLDASIEGTASGTYVSSGEQYQFVLEDTTGGATVSLQGVETEFDMGELANALAPVGQATIECTADGARLESESVSLELRRTGGGSGTGTAAPTGTSKPGGAPPASGAGDEVTGPLSINESNLTKTYRCAAAAGPISINGSGSRLTFTGQCPTISINGDDNVVTMETAGTLSLNGNRNAVTYSGTGPVVSDNGDANTVTKG